MHMPIGLFKEYELSELGAGHLELQSCTQVDRLPIMFKFFLNLILSSAVDFLKLVRSKEQSKQILFAIRFIIIVRFNL